MTFLVVVQCVASMEAPGISSLVDVWALVIQWLLKPKLSSTNFGVPVHTQHTI